MTGRLATVQPALRVITIVPEGESQIVELALALDAKIVQLDRELTLTALVIEVGRRVVIEYRVEGNRRIAALVKVEASEPADRAPI